MNAVIAVAGIPVRTGFRPSHRIMTNERKNAPPPACIGDEKHPDCTSERGNKRNFAPPHLKNRKGGRYFECDVHGSGKTAPNLETVVIRALSLRIRTVDIGIVQLHDLHPRFGIVIVLFKCSSDNFIQNQQFAPPFSPDKCQDFQKSAP